MYSSKNTLAAAFGSALSISTLLCVATSTYASESAWEYDASIYAIYDTHSFEGSVFTDDEDVTGTSLDYLRRVKASAEVAYKDNLSLETAIEYKDSDQSTSVDELTLNYQINKHIEFTIGKFKEPTGLENQLSLRYQPLLERSVPTNTLLFGRHSGIAFDIEHKHWTLDLAMTYQSADTNTYRDSLAHIARLTFAPVNKKKKFVHFGIDFSSRMGTEDVYDIDEPLIAAGVGNLVHSPNFFAREIKLQGLEFAARYKPVLFQTEYFEQRIKQVGLPDQTLHGVYATLVWTIIGSSRHYEHGKLKFSGKKKHTVELATRISSTNLTPVFRGDDADVTAIALNYFFKKRARVSLEYQDAKLTSNGRRNTTELKGESINGRLQIAF